MTKPDGETRIIAPIIVPTLAEVIAAIPAGETTLNLFGKALTVKQLLR